VIYSEPFDGMPEKAKNAVYARMWEILSGQERDKRYDVLTPADRRAILEILSETKPDAAAYFAQRKTPDTY
jgi:hypothetical protein